MKPDNEARQWSHARSSSGHTWQVLGVPPQAWLPQSAAAEHFFPMAQPEQVPPQSCRGDALCRLLAAHVTNNTACAQAMPLPAGAPSA